MSETWISAKSALELVGKHVAGGRAASTIYARASAGLVRAKAKTWVCGDTRDENHDIPAFFWQVDPRFPPKHNWATGDFEFQIRRVRWCGYGVEFLRQDIVDMLGVTDAREQATEPVAVAVKAAPIKSGRPSADWWEDLWIEICRQLYGGDLQPKRQADIERAMNEWITLHDFEAATSTVRDRARKLWRAIQQKDENPPN